MDPDQLGDLSSTTTMLTEAIQQSWLLLNASRGPGAPLTVAAPAAMAADGASPLEPFGQPLHPPLGGHPVPPQLVALPVTPEEEPAGPADRTDVTRQTSRKAKSEAQLKRERNREHARQSRLRKKVLTVSLQNTVREYQREVGELRALVRTHLPERADELLAGVPQTSADDMDMLVARRAAEQAPSSASSEAAAAAAAAAVDDAAAGPPRRRSSRRATRTRGAYVESESGESEESEEGGSGSEGGGKRGRFAPPLSG